jgi:hypothetical protein
MFLVLFILALLFYLERTIFVDPCYAVFNLLYYRDYVVEAGRMAAVAPQTLALLAIKLELPLKVILAVYSMSFILLYYLIFLVIAYLFKLDRLALAVPLLLMLGVKYSFFWISTETHQALVYTILLYAFLTWSMRFKSNLLFWLLRLVLAAGIMFLCFYSHPVSLFTVLFVLGFFIIDNKLWLKPDGYLLGALIIGLALFKFLTSSATGYESFYFRGFGEFFTRLGDVFHAESYLFLKAKILNIYLFSWMLFLITSVWYIIEKQYLKLGYYLISLLFLSLVLFTTFNIWYFPFIQEKNLMGLNIFLLIPFLKDVVFPAGRKQVLSQLFLIGMFVMGVAHVASASLFYRNRLTYIGNLITSARRFPEKKFIVSESMIDRNQLNVNWGLAPETLILSSLESPDSSISMYINDENGKIAEGTNLNDSLLFICAPWAKDLEIRRLDRHYFRLSNSPYRVLTPADMVQGNEISFYSNSFDDRSIQADSINYHTDSTGNSFYLLTSEFSPGFFGKYKEVTKFPAVMITATVRVFPMEKMNPEWLTLVISKEQNQKVLQYYRSGLDHPATLKLRQLNQLTVSGVVKSSDPNDQLKIYLWNPEKKKVGMDDFKITYRIIQ